MADPKSKRAPPFSLRLTQGERAFLEQRANGAPMGTFIRSVLFSNEAGAFYGGPSRADQLTGNRQGLSQILAKLGGSGMAANLHEISRLARLGALPLTPETEAEINQAAADIAAIKSMLMEALGIKEH